MEQGPESSRCLDHNHTAYEWSEAKSPTLLNGRLFATSAAYGKWEKHLSKSELPSSPTCTALLIFFLLHFHLKNESKYLVAYEHLVSILLQLLVLILDKDCSKIHQFLY